MRMSRTNTDVKVQRNAQASQCECASARERTSHQRELSGERECAKQRRGCNQHAHAGANWQHNNAVSRAAEREASQIRTTRIANQNNRDRGTEQSHRDAQQRRHPQSEQLVPSAPASIGIIITIAAGGDAIISTRVSSSSAVDITTGITATGIRPTDMIRPTAATHTMSRSTVTNESRSRSGNFRTCRVQLQREGYYQGSIDGLIGPHDADALPRYQADNGLT